MRPTVQRILDQMPMPAYLRNGRFDVLAANDLGRALYSPLYVQADPGEPRTAPGSCSSTRPPRTSSSTTTRSSTTASAFLRAEAGRDPYSKELSDLVGELSTRSEDFRRRWAAHDVRYHRTGRKKFHHPLVGDLELDFEAFELAGDPGQRINVYTAPDDSPSAAALDLLASWSLREPVRSTAAPTTAPGHDATA